MKERNYTVYCHTNKINGKKYVGITSQRLEDRWANGKGYKRCFAFYRAICKYGWEGFAHEVLFTRLKKGQAERKEVELIAKWGTLAPDGYNLETGGNSGKKQQKKSIQKAVESKRAKGIKTYKAVICLNTNEVFGSIGEATRKSGAKSISACCNGRSCYSGKTDDGLPIIWRFLEQRGKCPFDCDNCRYTSCIYSGITKLSIKATQFEAGHQMTKQTREALNKTMQKKVLQIDANSQQVIGVFDSIKDASAATGARQNTISEVCSGYKGQHRKTAGGYAWRYLCD